MKRIVLRRLGAKFGPVFSCTVAPASASSLSVALIFRNFMLQAVLPYIIGIQPSQTVASTPEPLKHRVPSSTGNSAYCHARSKDIDGGDRQCRLAASSSPATIPSLYASGSIDLEALGIHRALLDLGEILTYFQDEGKELASRTCEGLLRLQLETTATLAMVNARMICCHRLSQLYSTMLPPTYIFEVGSRILPAAFRVSCGCTVK